MNHPFWLTNNVLLFLFTFTSFFVYVSRVTLPEREDIEPLLYSKQKKEQRIAINIKHIYENDLFGTYYQETVRTAPTQVPFPEPPRPQRAIAPEPPKANFLEPLAITLKGIVVVSSDDSKNRAIITLNKTDQESSYKVGDDLSDAQLIRIFNNKVIFLRPNGQQEVVYLREQDAQLDPAYKSLGEWQAVIQKQDDFLYLVSPRAFTKRVKNIAQFIDLFGLTTAYQKGKSIGTRIGIINEGSLGHTLGFMSGDIVTSINAIPTATTDNRLVIYNQIINTPLRESISVHVLRKNRELDFMYTLEDWSTDQDAMPNTMSVVKANEIPIITVPTNSEKEAFSSTLKKMNDHEKHNMLAQGRLSNSV